MHGIQILCTVAGVSSLAMQPGISYKEGIKSQHEIYKTGKP